jgi:hypothetical protein
MESISSSLLLSVSSCPCASSLCKEISFIDSIAKDENYNYCPIRLHNDR